MSLTEDNLASAVEGWAGLVLKIRGELDHTAVSKHDHWGPFDLVGAYHHRQRLTKLLEGRESATLDAIDLLLRSFSDVVGTEWVNQLGLGDELGDGWWWSLAPCRGPLRDELDERVARGS